MWNHKKAYTSIIVVASVLIFVWFRKGLMLGYGESGLPFYNSLRLLRLMSATWYDCVLGSYFPQLPAGVPFYLMVNALERLMVPNYIAQASFFLMILVVGSLAVYELTLLVNGNNERIAPLLASIFYMLNPYAMTLVWRRFQYTFMTFYALAPLALLLLILGLKKRRYSYVVYIGIITVVFSLAYVETPFIGTFWLLMLSYIVYYVLVNLRDKEKIAWTIKFSTALVLVWFTFNSWWFLQFLSAFTTLEQILTSQGNLQILVIASRHTTPLYVLRMVYWYYTYIETIWGSIFQTLTFELIATMIPIIVSFSLLKRSKNVLLFYFALLVIITTYLAKGVAPPLGEFFQWLFINVPAFQVYRSPFEKFGILSPLAYAPLFGIGLSWVYAWVKSHAKLSLVIDRKEYKGFEKYVALSIIMLSSFSIFGVYLWPMWTGYVFTSPYVPANNPEIGYYVQVPNYYQEANEWIDKRDQSFRLMVLPLNVLPIACGGDGITYNWTYGYSGVELSNYLFDRPAISVITGITFNDDIIRKSQQVLLTSTRFWKLLAILNVKYLIVRSDVNCEVRNMMPIFLDQSKRILPEHIQYVKSFGKLDFYGVDDEYFLERIYAANKFILANDVDDMLFNLIPNDSFDPRDTVVFLRSQSTMNNITFLENLKSEELYKPQLTFEKIDPTKYVIKIENSTNPFFLVFSETYHPQWKAYYGDVNWIDAFSAEPIPDNYHFIVNGYANAWYINKTGTYTLTLYFRPQSLFYLGLIVSGLTLAVCIGYLAYDWKYRRR